MISDTPATAAQSMDRMYRRQRHVYDFTRKYYLLGRDRLIARLDAGPGMRVLEIGCGTARNLIATARRYPGIRCYGVDVSNEMLASARANVMRAGVGHCVMVAQGDATRVNPKALFGHGKFERVMISYSLSMIPEWQAALDHALTLVAPLGELHIVDFGRQEGLPVWCRTTLRRWLTLFEVTPRDDLVARIGIASVRHGAEALVERPYRGYAQYAVVTLPPLIAAAETVPSAAA